MDQGSGVVSRFGRASGEDHPPVSGDRALPTRKVKTRSGSSFLRNIDGLLTLQGNAQPSGKNTLSLAAMDHPGNACPNVHDWGQVCLFQGNNGRDFRAFTTRLNCFGAAPLTRRSALQLVRMGVNMSGPL